MDARVASKELLEFEKHKPSLLESNFLLYKEKEEDGETVRRKVRKKKRQDVVDGQEKGEHHIMATVPTSRVLGKVKDFLGVIAEANEKLQLNAQGNGHPDYDIEVLSGNGTEYIEMDLLLGVTDQQTPEALAVAEAALGGSHHYSPLFHENSSSDSEENSDEENDDTATISSLSHDKVPKPDMDHCSSANQSRKRPKVTVLN